MKMWSMRSLKKASQEVSFGKEQLCPLGHLCMCVRAACMSVCVCVCVHVCVLVGSVFQPTFTCHARAYAHSSYEECMRSMGGKVSGSLHI